MFFLLNQHNPVHFLILESKLWKKVIFFIASLGYESRWNWAQKSLKGLKKTRAKNHLDNNQTQVEWKPSGGVGRTQLFFLSQPVCLLLVVAIVVVVGCAGKKFNSRLKESRRNVQFVQQSKETNFLPSTLFPTSSTTSQFQSPPLPTPWLVFPVPLHSVLVFLNHESKEEWVSTTNTPSYLLLPLSKLGNFHIGIQIAWNDNQRGKKKLKRKESHALKSPLENRKTRGLF